MSGDRDVIHGKTNGVIHDVDNSAIHDVDNSVYTQCKIPTLSNAFTWNCCLDSRLTLFFPSTIYIYIAYRSQAFCDQGITLDTSNFHNALTPVFESLW